MSDRLHCKGELCNTESTDAISAFMTHSLNAKLHILGRETRVQLEWPWNNVHTDMHVTT